MTNERFINNACSFGSHPDENILTNNIQNDRYKVYMHPKGFAIDLDSCEYIPSYLIDPNLLNVSINPPSIIGRFTRPIFYTDDIINNNLGTLYYYSVNLSRDRFGHNWRLNRKNNYYFGNKIVLNNEGVVFCLGIKSSFIKQISQDILEELSNSSFYKLFIDKNLHSNDTLIDLINHRFNSKFLQIPPKKIIDNMRLFINTEAMSQLDHITGLSNREYLNSEEWSIVKSINETSRDWINSKFLAKVEIPKFDDIEGPEIFSKQALSVAT